jgi:hypothetical protein
MNLGLAFTSECWRLTLIQHEHEQTVSEARDAIAILDSDLRARAENSLRVASAFDDAWVDELIAIFHEQDRRDRLRP